MRNCCEYVILRQGASPELNADAAALLAAVLMPLSAARAVGLRLRSAAHLLGVSPAGQRSSTHGARDAPWLDVRRARLLFRVRHIFTRSNSPCGNRSHQTNATTMLN
jgi:hypothetical protein